MPTTKDLINGYQEDEPTKPANRHGCVNLFPEHKSSTKVYYSCEVCGKKGRIQKQCCGIERTKCYML